MTYLRTGNCFVKVEVLDYFAGPGGMDYVKYLRDGNAGITLVCNVIEMEDGMEINWK